ncbi:MAG: hypothetical protein RIA71_03025 [Oceanicaulis sp.]
MKKRIAQFAIAVAAVAMLSACIVINSTSEPDTDAFAPQSAQAAE